MSATQSTSSSGWCAPLEPRGTEPSRSTHAADPGTRLSHRGLDLDRITSRRPHGDRLRYMGGCRCLPCRAANSRYSTDRAAAQKAGDWNGLVDAEKTRKHLLRLSKAGVGRRAVQAASGVALTVIADIRCGRKRRIRARTERRILAVDIDARSDASIVPAGPTWRRINWLLSEGYTKTELARRLGSKAKVPALQIQKDFCLARTALAVERLWLQANR